MAVEREKYVDVRMRFLIEADPQFAAWLTAQGRKKGYTLFALGQTLLSAGVLRPSASESLFVLGKALALYRSQREQEDAPTFKPQVGPEAFRPPLPKEPPIPEIPPADTPVQSQEFTEGEVPDFVLGEISRSYLRPTKLHVLESG